MICQVAKMTLIKRNLELVVNENAATFKEIGSITIGGAGAAEISAYDEVSKSYLL
jgi:hypothetical protein